MDINKQVSTYRDDMGNFLQEMIRIPSLEEEAQPGAPFGKPCLDSLLHSLEHARKMGFERVHNVDGYAGYVEAGEGEHELGIIVHLDVVPVGRGWTMDPFGGEVKDNRIYGRGAMDDKGGLAASYYALKALCDLGVEFKSRVRVIIGCNEETGMKCMKYYKTVEKMPDYAFSPDADYPVINMEKGILQVRFEKAVQPADGGVRVLYAKAGERPNVVPGEADMCLSGITMQELNDALAGCDTSKLELKQQGENILIKAVGAPAHGSTPEKGDNAVWMLLDVLAKLPAEDDGLGQALLAMAEKLNGSYDGGKMDLAIKDESGALTCNLGILDATESNVSFTLDIRHPVTFEHEYILERLEKALAPSGFEMHVDHDAPNHCVPTDHPLVQILMDVYNEQTGSIGEPLATGGGTYARVLPNRAVAFGIHFPGTPDSVHQADEYIEIDELVKDAQIIAHAIYRLACEDTLWKQA